MRVTIEYENGLPIELEFEYIEDNDAMLLQKIVDRVTTRTALADYTYIAKGAFQVDVTYKDAHIQRVYFEQNSEILQRIIHMTVGNHFHMLIQECLHDIEMDKQDGSGSQNGKTIIDT